MKTIVLVHGAWADGSSWDKAVPLLVDKGHKVVAVHLPLSSLADDVAAVRRVIRAQTEPVLLEFAQDLPPADQRLLAAKQSWTAMAVFDGKPSKAAWKTKPAWYVQAANDRMIPPAAEEQMAKRMKAKVTSLAAGHVVMLSKPHEVAAVILEAANK